MFLHNLFGTDMSIGAIFTPALAHKTAEINIAYSLDSIKHIASDEIYHLSKPQLVVQPPMV